MLNQLVLLHQVVAVVEGIEVVGVGVVLMCQEPYQNLIFRLQDLVLIQYLLVLVVVGLLQLQLVELMGVLLPGLSLHQPIQQDF